MTPIPCPEPPQTSAEPFFAVLIQIAAMHGHKTPDTAWQWACDKGYLSENPDGTVTMNAPPLSWMEGLSDEQIVELAKQLAP
jgi:hypothetical protein